LPRPASEPPPPPRAAPYRLPVQGKVLTGFGEISDGGIHSRGILLQAAPNAPVTAPRAGRIVYAGRFRSYGQIVIVDHGGGWTSTITNLAALRVSKGDNVKAGDPLGRTRQDMPVGIELRRDGRPQPIVSFL
jgi:septal ring factor EnvC (AmiA/AmiB activator)